MLGRIEPADMTTAAAALRRAGWGRLALGYLAAVLLAVFAADAFLGPRGLGWFRGSGGAGGVGVALALTWAYLVVLRLGRGRTWPRALLSALPPALVLAGIAAVVMHLLRR